MAMHKYRAKKTIIDGITFDSKLEARRYSVLKLLEKAGEISDLTLQPKYCLLSAYVNGNAKKIRKINYIADFKYWDNKQNKLIIEDCKGVKTEVYKIKKKLFEKRYYPLTITEITR